jgi:S1-C subfamily serine protease
LPTSRLIQSNEPKPLGFVRWFEPEKLGLVVEANAGSLRVVRVDNEKLLGKCGFRRGDVIVDVGGVKVDTPAAFRKQLLKASLHEEDSVAVRRGDEVLRLDVDFRPLDQ